MESPDFKGLSANLLEKMLDTLLTLRPVPGSEQTLAFDLDSKVYWLIWNIHSDQAMILTDEGKMVVVLQTKTINCAIIKFVLQGETSQCSK